ncbi:quinoprotein dehydrogenase-associated SoxYZ-like carrier [Roseomonas marmotae]|uniref:Quinoprotein dehydrogenase-associated SoxYZ-like carrier n=1 Tax=Roseomonas marmotae TaxID=2768161 RepID=A0ABS3KEV3_9PROT|nr:quinoprotein dehydrogenase-associated SoxYZ-like carrier [Roseomonas marmotae]MBO1075542.1 quinoprotein dehydrogenase-associated SoxYZ-like carrier [Roseomonas marmotae]QTI81533.1 quinoprotein dehydrogenase-associated SoxYZ-like carrier [Roseomonas marmotae]
MPSLSRRPILGFAAAAALAGAWPARAQDEPRRAERWKDLRGLLFGDRPVEEAGEAITLTAPYRALDAGAVPVSIAMSPSLAPLVSSVSLIIDENPSPLAAVFRASQAGGLRLVSTRIRVDAYTFLRAVAETTDGRLLLAQRFIKAAGGCSAPMSSDLRAARERMGRARFSLPEGPPAPQHAVPVEVALSHPNTSGLQIDQVSRLSIPAEFVRHLRVSYGGAVVLDVESDISISENPTFGFMLAGEPNGELLLEAEDNRDRRFTGRWKVLPSG